MATNLKYKYKLNSSNKKECNSEISNNNDVRNLPKTVDHLLLRSQMVLLRLYHHRDLVYLSMEVLKLVWR
jgi:hypothetical protein